MSAKKHFGLVLIVVVEVQIVLFMMMRLYSLIIPATNNRFLWNMAEILLHISIAILSFEYCIKLPTRR